MGDAFAGLPMRPARIVSGPLTRTQETAAAIATPCGIDIAIEPRLVDRDYGLWTGHPAEELRARFGPGLADLPGAEPLEDVVERVRAVLDEQAAHLRHGPVVLVAHDVVNALLLRALDPGLCPPHHIAQRTACWNAIELASSGWRVRTVDGDAKALETLAAGTSP